MSLGLSRSSAFADESARVRSAASMSRERSPGWALTAGIASTVLLTKVALATAGNEDSGITEALVVAGLGFGPSVGYALGGRPGYALLSGAGRASLLALALATKSPGVENYFGALLFSGVLAWDLVDLIKLPASVRAENAKRSGMNLSLTPSVLGRHKGGFGFALTGQF